MGFLRGPLLFSTTASQSARHGVHSGSETAQFFPQFFGSKKIIRYICNREWERPTQWINENVELKREE